MTAEPPPDRVRITSPLTDASTRQEWSVTREIDEATGLGEVYVGSLVASQLRAAASVVITLVLTIGAMPLVFALLPDVPRAPVLGVPLAWILLVVLVYPGVWLLGWFYVRYAERAESDFAALVEPTSIPDEAT